MSLSTFDCKHAGKEARTQGSFSIIQDCKTSQEVGTHFVPMFLHTTLSAQGEGLRNLTPAAASIAQGF